MTQKWREVEQEKGDLQGTLGRAEDVIRKLRADHQAALDAMSSDTRHEITTLQQDVQELRIVVCPSPLRWRAASQGRPVLAFLGLCSS